MLKAGTLFAVAAVVVLSGCAVKPQLPVDLSPSSFSKSPQRIGVAMTAMPKVEVQVPGASCLLCLVAANVANLSLSKHAETLTLEDVPNLKQQVAERLRRKGSTVVVIPEALDVSKLPDHSNPGDNVARKNFGQLKAKYGIDKLFVVQINSVGFMRTYASYFPTSDPKSSFVGLGYMVNLQTNKYEWYRNINIAKSADGPWDEPPKFPGLTNAYFQALELGKEGFLKPLGD